MSNHAGLYATHAFLEVTKVGLRHGRRLRSQPAIEESAPFGIHFRPVRLVAVGLQHELQTVGHTE
jgi:hypothetical protein